jgi:hypothetical protein
MDDVPAPARVDDGLLLAAQLDGVAERARALLLLDGIGADDAETIRQHLQAVLVVPGGVRGACDEHADAIARTLGAPGRTTHKTLTPDGWLIFDFGLIRPSHVYAVGALMLAEASAARPDLVTVLDAGHLVSESTFMAGREGQKKADEGIAARQRSEAGAKGGRKKTVSDQQVTAAWERARATHAGREAAYQAMSDELGIAVRTVKDRVKVLNLWGDMQ